MIKRNTLLFVSFAIFFMASCSSAQINRALDDARKQLEVSTTSRPLKPTTEEVIRGLKQALTKGVEESVAVAGAPDGYYKNERLFIPLPPEIKEIEARLRQIGLGNQVDQFMLTLNRGAEEAAKEARPIFTDAITSMTINDAWTILNGNSNEATEYLRRTTYDDLSNAYKPVITRALDKTEATRYYSQLVNAYNRIPGVEDIDPNLEQYATTRAIDGLFLLVEDEEKKIREDPLARTTDLLKKVFGYED